jgi:hypothetical protein
LFPFAGINGEDFYRNYFTTGGTMAALSKGSVIFGASAAQLALTPDEAAVIDWLASQGVTAYGHLRRTDLPAKLKERYAGRLLTGLGKKFAAQNILFPGYGGKLAGVPAAKPAKKAAKKK